MSCKIAFPSTQDLWDKVSRDFSTYVLNGAEIIPESNEHYVRALMFAMQQEVLMYAEQIVREQDPRTASCDSLIDLAERDGVTQAGATPYRGYVKLTGTAGTAIPQDIQIEINGQTYTSAQVVPAVIGNDGVTYLYVEAVKPGTENQPTATSGTITDPPAGINETVDVMGNFCGASDAETCEQLRSRYLEYLRYSPTAGINWILEKAGEWPCASAVYNAKEYCKDDNNCRPGQVDACECANTLELYMMFQGTFPCGLAPDCIIDEANRWLFGQPQGYGNGQLPFGVCGRIRYTRPVFAEIRLSGAACLTGAQIKEIQNTLTDYIANLPPSATLYLQELRMLIYQIAPQQRIGLTIIPYTDGEGNETGDHLKIDRCGDGVPDCDYKICLQSFSFTDTLAPDEPCVG